MNLERLDGVTIAYDYDEALAELSRGFEQTRELTRTEDALALGVAMTPAVLRDGQVRTHMVLHGVVTEWLQDKDNPPHKQALYLLAHEAAHVEDLYLRDRAFPGTLLSLRLAHEDAVLFELADACWCEYAASRRSAFMDPEQGEQYEDTFCEALKGTRERGNAFIRDYRLHGDTGLLLSQLTNEYGALAKYAAYLVGHLAGLDRPVSEAAPRAQKVVEESGYFLPLLRRLSEGLETMWGTRESWAGLGLSAYDPVTKFARELLRVGGIDLSTRNGMLYMDVSYTDETMP